MVMLLNDPETYKILEAKKKLTDNSLEESFDNDNSSESSNSEQLDILPQYIKYTKSTKSKANKTIDV